MTSEYTLPPLLTMPDEVTPPTITLRAASDDLLPARAHESDAGWDVAAAENVVLPVGGMRLIPTTVRIDLPEGTYAMVCSRSGLTIRHGILVANAPGIIDSGYTGELMVSLINLGGSPHTVLRGERIAQLVFGRTDLVHVVGGGTLDTTARGDGGHGSSGR